MMRAVYSILAILFFITGCVPREPRNKNFNPLPRCEENPYSEQISEAIISYSEELADTHELFLYNSRVVFEGDVRTIRVDYTSQGSVELCEAREILVDIVEGLLERFNANPLAQSAFNDDAATSDDIEIHVTFQSYFNKFVDPTYTAYIILQKGTSFFYSSELDFPFTEIWMQKVEPYHKTKQLVDIKRRADSSYKEMKLKKNAKPKALEGDRLYPKGENP